MMRRMIWKMAALAALCVPAFAVEWMTDLEAAKAKAAAEGKAVLLDFTGSDWCGACIRLHKISLDTPEFEAYAKDRLVCVEVDVPRAEGKLPPEQLEENRRLVRLFRISSFPMVLVLTPQGVVAGGFGGNADIRETKDWVDKALAAAKVLQNPDGLPAGEQRAALQAVYAGLHPAVMSCAATLEEQIAALDPDDSSGMARKRQAERQAAELVEQAAAALQGQGGPQAVLGLVAEYERKLFPENALCLLQIKMNAMAMQAFEPQDMEQVRAAILKELDALDPKYADPAQVQQMRQALDRLVTGGE